MLAIPAVTICIEFNADAFRAAADNARSFATGFLGWGRLWYGLLLLALTGYRGIQALWAVFPTDSPSARDVA